MKNLILKKILLIILNRIKKYNSFINDFLLRTQSKVQIIITKIVVILVLD